MTTELPKPSDEAKAGALLPPATGSATGDYQKIAYEARDILNCGHVANVLTALAKLHTRYNDALARIATLERESPNAPGEPPAQKTSD